MLGGMQWVAERRCVSLAEMEDLVISGVQRRI